MQTEHLSVAGMTCGGCVAKVTRALEAADGVGDVKVSLNSGDVTVQYDEGPTSPDQLKLAVTGAGLWGPCDPCSTPRAGQGRVLWIIRPTM